MYILQRREAFLYVLEENAYHSILLLLVSSSPTTSPTHSTCYVHYYIVAFFVVLDVIGPHSFFTFCKAWDDKADFELSTYVYERSRLSLIHI